MIELVSESICVSKAAAKEALEARNWDVLEAAQLLQRQERARKAEACGASSASGCREWIPCFTAGDFYAQGIPYREGKPAKSAIRWHVPGHGFGRDQHHVGIAGLDTHGHGHPGLRL
jgi:hypothetical protein